MSAIFVIGSSNTDMVIKSAKLPAPGETKIKGIILFCCNWKMHYALLGSLLIAYLAALMLIVFAR